MALTTKRNRSIPFGVRTAVVISVFVLGMLMLAFCYSSDSPDYYRPLPLYTGSVNELNRKAVWTRTYNFGDVPTTSPPKPENLKKGDDKNGSFAFDVDQIMNDMATLSYSSNSRTSNINDKDKLLFRTEQRDSWLSTVKIIPDEHHVSAYLNKGVVKRFLFFNTKQGNPLSITVTPCTSILLWNVKLWQVSDNGTFTLPETLKTFRTQRTVSFRDSTGKKGVYGIEMKALYKDSYVHLYATSFNDEPLRVTPSGFTSPYDRSLYLPWSNIYDGLNPISWTNTSRYQKLSNMHRNGGGGVVADFHSQYVTSNRPRIAVKRLRGNRLHVKWDTSPVNPHLMQYCLVVNTRRDYSSLCAASGERFGVLPPDLMHVVYYGSSGVESDFGDETVMWNNGAASTLIMNEAGNNFTGSSSHFHLHKHRHNHSRSKIKRATKHTRKDIIIGCIGRKTNYILHNLHDGMLYFVNVFVRDMMTNVSYPYVRTTTKYRLPRASSNGLQDAKPTKIKLKTVDSDDIVAGKKPKPTTLKFNLNKPCSELSLYVMPCGGGSINFEVLHNGTQTVGEGKDVDSLEIVKIDSPRRGRYSIKIRQNIKETDQASLSHSDFQRQQARMVEVYIGKKNKRFPLPKLPAIRKISEDVSRRACDSAVIQWWPSPDPRDNEYCIFLKEETRKKRIFQFKPPNQCDVERSLKSDPYVSLSLCLQRDLPSDGSMFSQRIVGLLPGKTYVVHLIIKRHNGKALSYDLHHIKTQETCEVNEK